MGIYMCVVNEMILFALREESYFWDMRSVLVSSDSKSTNALSLSIYERQTCVKYVSLDVAHSLLISVILYVLRISQRGTYICI